jgi:hypothetical protein|uniref:Uncharacterized protein n=1 Tax=Eutreptiella gymnastica TaxID=73025 RepID=A0A7S4FGJ1_9EUGL|mmetsp:Transcript_82743/g.138072  ORF Transcript_82743/g.138072 Transcript_82743/m.138072 type:complete len:344 (-) Transcript_82743:1107-2138(-)
MALVESSAMENDGPFVSRETYGEEIRETFPQERADHLSARETFGNSADWYDHFTRGRRDWLKSASCTVVGDCTTHEGEFYKHNDAPYKYKRSHDKQKGAERMAMSCFYDRSAGDTEERSTCKTVVMRQGTNYNPEMESLASFRSMVALLKEEFIDDVKNPVVSYERNFITGELAITLWPPGMYEKAHSGDPEVDVLNHATWTYSSSGDCRSIENCNSKPSPEELEAQYEWVRAREEYAISECLAMERWLVFFLHGRESEKGKAALKDADDHAARLESMVRQLWAKVDASVMKAVAGDKKSEAYDGMASLLETKIAQLEQELRAKDKLIRELSTAEPPSPVWLQ